MFEMNVPYDKGTMKISLPEKNLAGVLEGKQSEYTTELSEKELVEQSLDNPIGSKSLEELAKGNTLYCLGDIVHNGQECERLKKMGLITINHEEFAQLHDAKVLLRAHGEPPETYAIARTNNIEIIDATCPVVLRLQKRIKQEYDNVPASQDTQIVIYGKNGHAEVLGLVGQTHGKAIVTNRRF